MPNQAPKAGQYRYEIRKLRHSSERYGPCEICKGFATVVHTQTEERYFEHVRDGVVVGSGWTFHNTKGQQFGHLECLIKARQANLYAVYDWPALAIAA